MADTDIEQLLDFGEEEPTVDKPTDDFSVLNIWKNGQKNKYRSDGPCPLEDHNEAVEVSDGCCTYLSWDCYVER